MQKLIGFSVALLATVMLVGNVLAGSGTNPPANANPSNPPLLHISYTVNNDEDSGVVGYWALDNYVKDIYVYNTSTSGTYVVYASYNGTFCTFAGALSPHAGTVEPNNGCGTMTGGYDATFTSVNGLQTPAIPLQTSYEFGGTKADVLFGTYVNQYYYPDGSKTPHIGTPYNWLAAYFPDSTGLATQTPWSWTYTFANGQSWVNDISGNTGDVVTSSSPVNLNTNIICNSNTDCASGYSCVDQSCVPQVCGLTATGSVNFGNLLPGATVQSGQTTTVANTGNIVMTPEISGDIWKGNNYASQNDYMPVGATSWTITPWSPLTPLTSIAASITGPLSPLGTVTVYYQLTVPPLQPTDSYKQPITFSTTC